MKESKKLVIMLNSLLADELFVINQYLVQSEMYSNSGYIKLLVAMRKQAMDEMLHADKLTSEVDDESPIHLLTKILKMEEGYVDWAEMHGAQIDQMGFEHYLASQN